MIIGVNWTSPSALPVIESLLAESRIGFCEILIDNFLHLDPERVREALGDTPISFHIMWSRFLERDEDELPALARLMRIWIEAINPIYVSDHLARFSVNGRTLPITAEIDYTRFTKTREKLARWQDLLGAQLLIENFPSARHTGLQQADFYARLFDATGCGLLFDVSNAIVAKRNSGADPNAWLALADNCTHFHIAGFRDADTQPTLTLDSHDADLDEQSLKLLEAVRGVSADQAHDTLVIERDANIGYQEWSHDIDSIQAIRRS